MWPWWIDVFLVVVGTTVLGLAITRVTVRHFTRGFRGD
jgi:hypothetical protein